VSRRPGLNKHGEDSYHGRHGDGNGEPELAGLQLDVDHLAFAFRTRQRRRQQFEEGLDFYRAVLGR
jgi:hypothetical protein